MIIYKQMLEEAKKETNIVDKTAILTACLNVLKNENPKLSISDRNEIFEYAFEELKPLEKQIENAKTYKERDSIFALCDKLLSLIMLSKSANENTAQTLISLLECVNKYRVLENAIDEMFAKDKIGENDVKKVLEKATETKETYEKGRLFAGLMHYEKMYDKISDEGKNLIVKFLNKETLEGVLAFDKLDEDGKYNLEILCDLLRLYYNKDTVRILKTAEQIENPAIAFYSADSLLELDEVPDKKTISYLANNIVYACLIHDSLEKNGLIEMFPKELDDEVYLAKSDLVHWLCYPTELGKEPDEIEFLGKAKKHKEVFHVFKYKSNSDKLPEEKHNVWLVGWSGSEGGTFSDFDLLSDFEKKTEEKTFKNIVKKCL